MRPDALAVLDCLAVYLRWSLPRGTCLVIAMMFREWNKLQSDFQSVVVKQSTSQKDIQKIMRRRVIKDKMGLNLTSIIAVDLAKMSCGK